MSRPNRGAITNKSFPVFPLVQCYFFLFKVSNLRFKVFLLTYLFSFHLLIKFYEHIKSGVFFIEIYLEREKKYEVRSTKYELYCLLLV